MAEHNTETTGKKSRKMIWISGGVAIALIGIVIILLSFSSRSSVEDLLIAIQQRDLEGVLSNIETKENAAQDWNENTVAYLFETLNDDREVELELLHMIGIQKADLEGEPVSFESLEEISERSPFLIYEGSGLQKDQIVAQTQRVVVTSDLDDVEINFQSEKHTINEGEELDLGEYPPGKYSLEAKADINGQEVESIQEVHLSFFNRETKKEPITMNTKDIAIKSPLDDAVLLINNEEQEVEWSQVDTLGSVDREYEASFGPVVEGTEVQGVLSTPIGDFMSEIFVVDDIEEDMFGEEEKMTFVFNVLDNEEIKEDLFELLESYELQKIEAFEEKTVENIDVAISDEIMNSLRKRVDNLSMEYFSVSHYEGILRQIRMENRTDSIRYNERNNIEVMIPFEVIVTEDEWLQGKNDDKDDGKQLSDSINVKMVTFEYTEDGWLIKEIENSFFSYDDEGKGDAKREEYK